MAPARISLALALNLLISTTSGPCQTTPGPVVVQVLHAAEGVFDLHDRPFAGEQPGEADGLGQRPAAVVAEVEDHRVDVLLA